MRHPSCAIQEDLACSRGDLGVEAGGSEIEAASGPSGDHGGARSCDAMLFLLY